MNVNTSGVEAGSTSAFRQDVVAPVNRTSWGAIWAGFFVALAVEFVLTVLMVGIFASFVHPGGGTPSGLSFGIGIAIWFFLQTLGAFYTGGWVTGKLAGKPDRWWNALHSFAVWGLTTAVLVYILVAAAGSAVTGTLDLVRSGLGIATSAAQAAPATTSGAIARTQSVNVGNATKIVGNAAKSAGAVGVAIATWIPIFLFITFGVSLAAALGGGLSSTPDGWRGEPSRVTRGTAS